MGGRHSRRAYLGEQDNDQITYLVRENRIMVRQTTSGRDDEQGGGGAGGRSAKKLRNTAKIKTEKQGEDFLRIKYRRQKKNVKLFATAQIKDKERKCEDLKLKEKGGKKTWGTGHKPGAGRGEI